MIGEAAIPTRPILHEYRRAIIIPNSKQETDSMTRENVSVVRALSYVMSSDIMLLSTPGALSLLSNQARGLYISDSYRSFLMLKVRFSPT
jgi:hypothetical protein